MYQIKPLKIVQRNRNGALVASGYAYDDATDVEHDVIISFDYVGAQADQPNPDRPNPGPGRDAEVDVTSVSIDSDQNESIPVDQCQYDPADFFELADEFSRERSQRDVSWARKVAGI